MQGPWFYCPELRPGAVRLPEAEGRHALRSLRLRPGDALTLFDGQGQVARATLAPAEREPRAVTAPAGPAARGARACVAVVETIESTAAPTRQLTLIVAACKGGRLDWLVEKCTELGVAALVVAEFERSVVRPQARHAARLRRTAIEACKQCRRAWLPRIQVGVSLAVASTALGPNALLVAHPGEPAVRFALWLRERAAAPRQVAVVIGPEGGLSPGELNWLKSRSASFVSLGPHILRVETAAVAAAAAWSAWDAHEPDPTRGGPDAGVSTPLRIPGDGRSAGH